MINLSPSPDRTGRACVCVLEGRYMLMVSYDDFFTFPGGGVNPGESFEAAAVREAYEEAGATVKLERFLFSEPTDQGDDCHYYLASLERIEPSPEGRIVRWVNALEHPWSQDKQIKPVLAALELRGVNALG
jgi:8-oxo-dGTP pyrophosphatase MutT (NUDIX family)